MFRDTDVIMQTKKQVINETCLLSWGQHLYTAETKQGIELVSVRVFVSFFFFFFFYSAEKEVFFSALHQWKWKVFIFVVVVVIFLRVFFVLFFCIIQVLIQPPFDSTHQHNLSYIK